MRSSSLPSLSALALGAVLFGLAPALPARAQDGPHPGQESAPRPDAKRFQAARAELIKAAPKLRIEGAAVGFAAQEGRFYRLASELAASGTRADFVALLGHEQVAVRAAGIYCVARRLPDEARRLLSPRLESAAKIELCTGGCTVERATEGDLACGLLLNRNLLERLARSEPVVKVALAESEPQAERLRWAIAGLRYTTRGVAGYHLGRGGGPSPYYALTRELIACGDLGALQGLTKDPRVHVRVAGLIALAQRFPEEARAALAARAKSTVEVHCRKGCLAEKTTEGELVRRLQADPKALD